MPLLVVALGSCRAQPALPELPQVSVSRLPPQVQQQVTALLEAVRKAPRDPKANGQLAMALHAYQDYDLAATLYQRARLLDPADFRWAYYHALVLDQLSRRPEAVAALRRALELKPGDPEVQVRLAELLLATDQLAESRTLYERLAQERPRLVAVQYGFGRLLEREGKLEEAIPRFEKAIEVGGPLGPVYYALALAHRRLGKTAEAQRYLALYEQNRDNRLPTGPYVTEIEAFQASDRPLVARGLQLLRAGKYAEAATEYEKAIALNPQAVAAHANLVLLYGNLNQIQKAEAHYREVTARNPDYAPAHFNLAMIRLRQQRLDEAAEAFRRALDADPYFAEAYVKLGSILEAQGWWEQALEQYQRAVAGDPKFLEAHYRVGLLLATRGQFEKAIEHLQQSLEAETASTTPWRLRALGRAYAQAGKYDLARSTLDRARRLAAQAQNGELIGLIDQNLDQLARARSQRAAARPVGGQSQ
jgi:protein O-GlcNAc transferase